MPVSSEDPKQTGDEEEEQRVVKAKDEEESSENDPYYPPIIVLPEVIINSGEEDEEVDFRMRAKLFRFDEAEWKERGTGDVKLLRHKDTGAIRVLMRRDKTLKICANHAVQPWMLLKPNCGSERAFVWSVQADYAVDGGETGEGDVQPKPQLFAIKFANAENAGKFKAAFENAVKNETKRAAEKIKAQELAQLVDKVEIAEK